MITARRIRTSELPSASITLAQAFADDPYLAWLTAEAPGMPSAADFFSGQVTDAFKRGKSIDVTDGLESVAIWEPRRAELTGSVGTPPHVAEVLARIDRSIPREHHYALEWIGTRSNALRRGYASVAIQPYLTRCDLDLVGAALWTSNPGSFDFYARHGFAVREKIEFPAAPGAWWLWRDPRGASAT
jgi:hypothetical protein